MGFFHPCRLCTCLLQSLGFRGIFRLDKKKKSGVLGSVKFGILCMMSLENNFTRIVGFLFQVSEPLVTSYSTVVLHKAP
jgi:hypothetical protein